MRTTAGHRPPIISTLIPASERGLSDIADQTVGRSKGLMCLGELFNDRSENVRAKVIGIYILLAIANTGAWIWAIVAFRNFPVLLGTAALAYSFGLRHAFDADHIAAIDNVTRKLMQEGRRPVGVGLFFSLGHSTIVVALSIALAITATALQNRFDAFKSVGSIVGTAVSALFLFAIAVANVLVLILVYRAFQTV
jgi:nickel/cobalt transporter (NiCoT) family protein